MDWLLIFDIGYKLFILIVLYKLILNGRDKQKQLNEMKSGMSILVNYQTKTHSIYWDLQSKKGDIESGKKACRCFENVKSKEVDLPWQ